MAYECSSLCSSRICRITRRHRKANAITLLYASLGAKGVAIYAPVVAFAAGGSARTGRCTCRCIHRSACRQRLGSRLCHGISCSQRARGFASLRLAILYRTLPPQQRLAFHRQHDRALPPRARRRSNHRRTTISVSLLFWCFRGRTWSPLSDAKPNRPLRGQRRSCRRLYRLRYHFTGA